MGKARMSPAAMPHLLWVAKVGYPDRKPAQYGTIVVRAGAPNHEIEAEALKGIADFLPIGAALPAVLELHRGQLVFVEDDNAQT